MEHLSLCTCTQILNFKLSPLTQTLGAVVHYALRLALSIYEIDPQILITFDSEAAAVVVIAVGVNHVQAAVGQHCYEAINFGAKNSLSKLVPECVQPVVKSSKRISNGWTQNTV